MNRPIPFGKYYLLERINVGGMAEVFRAKAYGVEGFERLLAVKKILPNIAADEEFIDMFIDEAKIAVQLNHANIAQIFDLGKVEKAYFIALEYVHGRDLRAIFDRTRSLSEMMPVPQSCFVVMKICEGLDYAHNKRDQKGGEMHLVHRDVSPQNVLVSYDGEVKLVDFGIAKAAGKASKTQAGILKGKFGYMSPEQVRGLPLDRRSDIFSVGIILYELLTGERLFLGETDFATLEKVRNVEIVPPSTYNRKISDELEQIVMRALARDVEDRYQNAIDLHDDLQAYMYTSGEFYSRKDLAAWMKRTWAREIEEEGRKLEAYREMPIPEAPPPTPPIAENPPQEGAAEAPTDGGGPPPRRPGVEMAPEPEVQVKGPALTWDDDEVDTQIYDKPGGSGAHEVEEEFLPLEPEATTEPARRSAPETGPFAVMEAAEEMPRVPVLRPRAAEPQPSGARGTMAALVVLLVLVMAGAWFFLVHSKRPGRVTLRTVPPTVELFVDGRRQAARPSPLVLEGLKPGFHVLVALSPGYQRWERTVEVTPGGESVVDVKLLALPSVELRTIPVGANVRLDGKKLAGLTDMRISELSPGRHRLEIRKAGFQPHHEDFNLRPAQKLRLNVRLLPFAVRCTVNSTPTGAMAVLVDAAGKEKQLGRTPVSVQVNPKHTYRIVIRKEGYRDHVTTRVVFDGAKPIVISPTLVTKVSASDRKAGSSPKPKPVARPKPAARPRSVFKPKPVPRPAPKPVSTPKVVPKPRPVPKPKATVEPKPKPKGKGTLMINAKPWARIFIDGRDTGLTTPQKSIRLSAGKHTITLKNPKFGIEKTFTVFIRPNAATKVIKRFATQ